MTYIIYNIYTYICFKCTQFLIINADHSLSDICQCLLIDQPYMSMFTDLSSTYVDVGNCIYNNCIHAMFY